MPELSMCSGMFGESHCGDLAGADSGGVLGHHSPVGGIILSSIPTARNSLGENPVHVWKSDGGATNVVPSLEASSLETQLDFRRRFGGGQGLSHLLQPGCLQRTTATVRRDDASKDGACSTGITR